MRHVVWDWNGTLLDDFGLNVVAVDESCRSIGGGGVTETDYRDHYTRPVTLFYERLLGRPLAEGEWDRLDAAYHAAYRRGLEQATLTPRVEEALRLAAGAGLTQSLLSMWEHDELLRLVRAFGLSPWFVRVDGQPGHGSATKLEYLDAHLQGLDRQLGPLRRDEVLMVGDTFDDADAAARLGLRCVLVEHGPHHAAALRAAGHTVVASVVDALAAAGVPTAAAADVVGADRPA